MVGFLGPTEMILIIVLVAIFFFGKDKVLDWVRSIGEAKNEFNEAKDGKTKKTKKKK